MPNPNQAAEPKTDVFLVTHVQSSNEIDDVSVVHAKSLLFSGVIHWFNNNALTPEECDRRDVLLDSARKNRQKSVAWFRTRHDEWLLLIEGVMRTGSEAGEMANPDLTIGGDTPVFGIDGEEIPAIELHVGDRIALTAVGKVATLSLISLAKDD
jgi:hypothetical protein